VLSVRVVAVKDSGRRLDACHQTRRMAVAPVEYGLVAAVLAAHGPKDGRR
jgi:hypothetical protein